MNTNTAPKATDLVATYDAKRAELAEVISKLNTSLCLNFQPDLIGFDNPGEELIKASRFIANRLELTNRAEALALEIHDMIVDRNADVASAIYNRELTAYYAARRAA